MDLRSSPGHPGRNRDHVSQGRPVVAQQLDHQDLPSHPRSGDAVWQCVTFSLISNDRSRLTTFSAAGQGFFDKVVACSSTPALAHHLEVAEDELMLSCASFNSHFRRVCADV